MAQKLYALDLDNKEWSDLLTGTLGEPRFRGDQVCSWLWQKHVFDIEEMTNLSKLLREALAGSVDFSLPETVAEQRSKLDGTGKYLWRFRDDNTAESVLMHQGDRFTACVSTQVGCPLGCTFCATGLSGYVRNLSAGEIAAQFLAMEKYAGREINNIVYMGMGEPFLNTDAVLKSIRMLNSPKQRNLGIRHITVSTSGVIPGIEDLAKSGLGVRLAVSLHAVDNELRSSLMPVNDTFPVSELRAAMQAYQKETGDRITIEYVLLGGVNDTAEHARALVRYLKGIHVFVNLIPFNAVEKHYDKPKPQDMLRFRNILTTAGFESEIRSPQGADIDAACGQLRIRTPERKEGALSNAVSKRKPRSEIIEIDDRAAKPTIKRSTGGFVEPKSTKEKRRPGVTDRKIQRGNASQLRDRAIDKRRKEKLPERGFYCCGKMKGEYPTCRMQTEESEKRRIFDLKSFGSSHLRNRKSAAKALGFNRRGREVYRSRQKNAQASGKRRSEK